MILLVDSLSTRECLDRFFTLKACQEQEDRRQGLCAATRLLMVSVVDGGLKVQCVTFKGIEHKYVFMLEISYVFTTLE